MCGNHFFSFCSRINFITRVYFLDNWLLDDFIIPFFSQINFCSFLQRYAVAFKVEPKKPEARVFSQAGNEFVPS